jgi:hypothetical protein
MALSWYPAGTDMFRIRRGTLARIPQFADYDRNRMMLNERQHLEKINRQLARALEASEKLMDGDGDTASLLHYASNRIFEANKSIRRLQSVISTRNRPPITANEDHSGQSRYNVSKSRR